MEYRQNRCSARCSAVKINVVQDALQAKKELRIFPEFFVSFLILVIFLL